MTRLNQEQISEAMLQIADGFKKLGFKTLQDPMHVTHLGCLGVYLVAHEKGDDGAAHSPLDDHIWFRVQVADSPMMGQRAMVDFKAGPHFWLQHEVKLAAGAVDKQA